MSERGWTEMEMKNYIMSMLPGISHNDYWAIRNRFVYESVHLEKAVADYWREAMIKKLNQRTDKKYWKVITKSGVTKVVCMVKELLDILYDGCEYELIG